MSAKAKTTPTGKDTLERIEQDAAALDALLFETGGDLSDGADQAIEQFFAELDERRRAKVDGYGWRIQRARDDAAKWKALAAEFTRRARQAEATEEYLLRKMAGYMEAKQLEQLPGDVHTFAFQANGGKLPVVLLDEDPAHFPPDCVRTTVDKEAVRARLEAGDESIPAAIGERGRSLRLR